MQVNRSLDRDITLSVLDFVCIFVCIYLGRLATIFTDLSSATIIFSCLARLLRRTLYNNSSWLIELRRYIAFVSYGLGECVYGGSTDNLVCSV